MQNIAIILTLLLGSTAVAKLSGVDTITAGRIGIAAVFAFTALGHFVKHRQMVAMLPPSLPWRSAIVTVSGFFEAALAAHLVTREYSGIAGRAACVFLIFVVPVNVYAAIQRADCGGHAMGPKYLWARLPLQAVLLVWTIWFTVCHR